jgi:hypothetical protein
VDSRRVLSKVGGMDVDVMVEVKAAGAQLPPKRFFISLSLCTWLDFRLAALTPTTVFGTNDSIRL